jgi:uncharacterized membrane protein/uncharacterized RDD family membrane protein YckC
MDLNILRLSLDFAASYLMVLFVFAALYIYYRQSPGFMESCGLTKSEVALLLFGSIVGILGEIPVFIWGKSLLSLNVGGAVIPILISIYLLRKKLITDWNAMVGWVSVISAFAALFSLSLLSNVFLAHSSSISVWGNELAIPYLFIALVIILDVIVAVFLLSGVNRPGFAVAFLWTVAGVQVVSFVSWYVSYIYPGLGIASDFPYYFLPGVVSAAMGLALFRRDISKAAPFAYICATLGTLLGADISRIPLLFRDFGSFTGSIGGAGPFDLVFLSGMLALSITFLFASRADRQAPRKRGWTEVSDRKKDEALESAEIAFSKKDFTGAVKHSLASVDEGIGKCARRLGARVGGQEILSMLGVHPYKVYDYKLLSDTARLAEVTEDEARRALFTARLLLGEIARAERTVYASTLERVGAFLLDFAILMAIIVPIALAIFMKYPPKTVEDGFLEIPPALIAVILWALASQLVYFTLSEWLFGKSIGKKVMGIAVVTADQERAGFMRVFARNVFRMLDISLFIIVTLVLIAVSGKKQRLGDSLAGTVVIRRK